ncbi:MAG TPA: HAD family hydrolase, partial [Gemmatimonadaceae bacterium]|nr:HAD family hydrolase [Gemmatimonadaceae bacterium]
MKVGCDFERAKRERASGQWPADVLAPEDLYPDALPCLATLRAQGYVLGLAGNQPAAAEGVLSSLGLPVDVIASSERLGVEKPSPE